MTQAQKQAVLDFSKWAIAEWRAADTQWSEFLTLMFEAIAAYPERPTDAAARFIELADAEYDLTGDMKQSHDLLAALGGEFVEELEPGGGTRDGVRFGDRTYIPPHISDRAAADRAE